MKIAMTVLALAVMGGASSASAAMVKLTGPAEARGAAGISIDAVPAAEKGVAPAKGSAKDAGLAALSRGVLEAGEAATLHMFFGVAKALPAMAVPSTPEPGTLAMLPAGLAVLALRRRRARASA